MADTHDNRAIVTLGGEDYEIVASKLAERIFHPRRYFGINGACDDAVGFHRAKAVGKDLLTDAFERLHQFIEPPRTDKQISQYQQFPLISDELYGSSHRAFRQFFFFYHGDYPPIV